VSLFVSNDLLRFSLYGPDTVVRRTLAGWSPPPGWQIATSTHGELALVELSEPRAGVRGGHPLRAGHAHPRRSSLTTPTRGAHPRRWVSAT
jgi:hypothetical protein